MSRAESATNGNGVDRTVDKTVQVVAYLADQSYEDWRTYADDHDDSVDYFEKDTRENVSYYLTGFGESVEISEEQYITFSQNNIGLMSVRKEYDTDSEFINRPRRYVRSVKNTALESMADDISDVFEKPSSWRSRLEHVDSECYVSFFSDTRVMGMLKHQSEISEDDMFDDMEQKMAMIFRINVKGASEDLMDYIDEAVIAGFIRVLSKSDEIAQIRVYDCEVETKEKGACFTL